MLTAIAQTTINPLLLRLMVAAIFLFHGLPKVSPDAGWGAGWNPQLDTATQTAVAWGEVIGGAALALGLLTRLAALGIIAIMAGAIATVHGPHGFSLAEGGFEYNAAIITMCLCLVLGGGGPLAVDRYFHIRRRTS